MREIFARHGLGLKIEANLQVTDFLDVLLDLKEGTHRAWVKPEQIIHYVHRESNHPAHVLKNIPLEVQRRLTTLSSNQAMFEAAKAPFQDALQRAGYDHQLIFSPTGSPSTRRRRRRRNILWFNPPFCKSVKTNVGRQFLQLLDHCFPRGHPLQDPEPPHSAVILPDHAQSWQNCGWPQHQGRLSPHQLGGEEL